MKCSCEFFELNEIDIREKCAKYCSISAKTLYKIIDADGKYKDDRGS